MQEYDDEEELLPHPSQISLPPHQFRSLSIDTRSYSVTDTANPARKSAFSYLSSRGKSRHDHREQDYTRVNQLLFV